MPAGAIFQLITGLGKQDRFTLYLQLHKFERETNRQRRNRLKGHIPIHCIENAKNKIIPFRNIFNANDEALITLFHHILDDILDEK